MGPASRKLLKVLLLCHAVLALRWLAIPAAAWAVSGNVIVGFQLLGFFLPWALAVLASDVGLSASRAAESLCELLPSVSCLAAGPLTGIILALAAPAPSVYLALAAAAASFGTLACARTALIGRCRPKDRSCVGSLSCGCWSQHPPMPADARMLWWQSILYTVWTSVKSLVDIALAVVLQWAIAWVLSSSPGTGAVEVEWKWLWSLMIVNQVLTWVSVLLVAPALWLLWHQTLADARSAEVREDERNMGSSHDEPEEAATSDGVMATEGSSSQPFGGAEKGPKSGPRCSLKQVSLWLLAAITPLSGVLWRCSRIWPGIWVPEQAPLCSSCHCSPVVRGSAVTVLRDVPYGQAFNQRSQREETLVTDIFLPRPSSSNSSAQSPAIVMLHGGAFKWGSKEDPIVAEEAKFFAEHGFVVFNINYRLESIPGGLPEHAAVASAVADAKAAIRFARRYSASYGVDSGRIATWGTSAGAITSATLRLIQEEGESGNPGFDSSVNASVGLSGCLWPFFIEETTSSSWAQTPWLDIHGTSDMVVLPTFAAVTHSFLQALGTDSSRNQLVWVRGGPHEPWLEPLQAADPAPRDLVRPHVLPFLVKNLRLEQSTCGA